MEQITINTIFEKIEKKGIDDGYINFSAIGILDKSCCTESKTIVIDFDKFKEKAEGVTGSAYKSCDALILVREKEKYDFIQFQEPKIDFIELKGMNKFVKFSTSEIKDEKIANKVIGFELHSKIEDSLLIFDNFIRLRNFLTQKEQNLLKNVKIGYILLTDIDTSSIEWGTLQFEHFMKFNSNLPDNFIDIMEREFSNIDKKILARIEMPLLKTCTEIDDYYATV